MHVRSARHHMGGNPVIEEMMQGLLGGGIWTMPLVQQVIFPARSCEAKFPGATTGPIRDGTVDVGGGVVVGYRAYVADAASDKVALHFHGNAEVCGDADDAAALFHRAGYNLVSVDYRGYGWSTGSAGVTHLTGDAEAVLKAVLAGDVSGIPAGARVVCWGRSIGALSAVHLAAARPARVFGLLAVSRNPLQFHFNMTLYESMRAMFVSRSRELVGKTRKTPGFPGHRLIVDSGLMAIAKLPMVTQLAESMLGPSGRETLKALADPTAAPFGSTTLDKAATVGCPSLVVHGEDDEIVPVKQGVACHDKLGSASKALERLPACGHNDVFLVHAARWTAAVSKLLADAAVFENVFPSRAAVETSGLSAAAFNGRRGVLVAPARAKAAGDPRRGRVKFDDAALGEKALKLDNLTVVDREPFLQN